MKGAVHFKMKIGKPAYRYGSDMLLIGLDALNSHGLEASIWRISSENILQYRLKYNKN